MEDSHLPPLPNVPPIGELETLLCNAPLGSQTSQPFPVFKWSRAPLGNGSLYYEQRYWLKDISKDAVAFRKQEGRRKIIEAIIEQFNLDERDICKPKTAEGEGRTTIIMTASGAISWLFTRLFMAAKKKRQRMSICES